MRKIDTLPLGSYQTNCYLVWAEVSSRCVVIDPGYEPDTILDSLEGLTLKAILLTHGHIDHMGAAKAIKDLTGAKIALGYAIYSPLEKIFSFKISDEDMMLFSRASEEYLLNQLGHSFRALDFYNSVKR